MRFVAFQRLAIFDDPVKVGRRVLRVLTWADRLGAKAVAIISNVKSASRKETKH
jgi:hypothetical protein